MSSAHRRLYLLCRLFGHKPLGYYRGYMRCQRCGARGDL